MNKNQFLAIKTYYFVRFGAISTPVYKVFETIESDARRLNCEVCDVINAFVDYDAEFQQHFGSKVTDNIVKHYLKSKTAKAIGEAYEEAMEEIRGEY